MAADFTVDISQAYAWGTYLQRLSTRLKTPVFISAVLGHAHAEMSAAFEEHMDALASSPAGEHEFHHMYEWGESGEPQGRLWSDVLLGEGTSRVATFEYLPSQTYVPVVHPDAGGVSETHIFVWKAKIMEENTPVTITPINPGGWLVYFTGPQTPEDKWEIKFTKNPIFVNNPGGQGTAGSFTKEYIQWWSETGGPAFFAEALQKVYEKDIAEVPSELVGKRSFSKNASMLVLTEESGQIGREAADRKIARLTRKYLSGRNVGLLYG